jgi:hypothetical protein
MISMGRRIFNIKKTTKIKRIERKGLRNYTVSGKDKE